MRYIISLGLLVLSAVLLGIYFNKASNTISVVGEAVVTIDSTQKCRAVIDFQLEQPLEVFVKYWIDKDEDKSIFSPVSSKSVTHSIVLLGLKGSKKYNFKIIETLDDQDKIRESQVLSFSTPKLSDLVMLRMPWTKISKINFNGFILSQRSLNIRRPSKPGELNGYLFLTDSVGETIWYQEVPGLPKLSNRTDRNTILVLSGNPSQEPGAGDHIYEYDLYGNMLVSLDLNSLEVPIEAHHEIRYSQDGSLLTLIYDKRRIKFSVPSHSNHDRDIKGDAIVKLNKEGKIIWKWSVFDSIDPTKSGYKIDSLGEWGHANALSVDLDGNYLVSFREWNQIWKINSIDGTLMWKLGENGDFALPEEFYFSGQHSIHINHKGEYMMFDNGLKRKKSRVICFKLDEINKKFIPKLNILLPEKLYSENRGSAFYIQDKYILVCASASSAVAIIDEEGNLLAQGDTGLADYYRAVYVPKLYPADENKVQRVLD